jgi:hypothetical protein
MRQRRGVTNGHTTTKSRRQKRRVGTSLCAPAAGAADENDRKAGPAQVDNDTAAIPRPPAMKTTNAIDELLKKWDAERTSEKEAQMPTANDERHRQLLVSSGEHIHAIRKLGSSYDAESYLQAVTEARELQAGERYADACLGPDLDKFLSATEQDDDVIEAAHRDLRQRGVDPESATYEQLASALARVSP